jgi:ATP-dependent protease ClpP protease subunit
MDEGGQVMCKTQWVRLGLIVVILAGSVGVALGDTLVLKDGRRFEGTLISETAEEIVFEAIMYGSIYTKMTFPAAEVEKVIRGEVEVAEDDEETEEARGPTYVVVPIRGVIGVDVVDSVFEKALRRAEKLRPTAIVLQIDSPGGMVAELSKLLETLHSCKHRRVVAYVEEAASAAAVLAMACPEIIMAPRGTLGGAVVYRLTPDGTPENIEEKMASLLRAEFRAVVEKAGHEWLLLEGMMKTEGALSYVQERGGARVERGKSKDAELLKRDGEILTLAPEQAVACGLALGTADDLDTCAPLLGVRRWRAGRTGVDGYFRRWERDLESGRARLKETLADYELTMARIHGHMANMNIGGVQNELAQAQRLLRRVQSLIERCPPLRYTAGDVDARQHEIEQVQEMLSAATGRR